MKEIFKTKNLKILIMDAPIGSGHVIAAKALKAELERQFVGAQIQHISTFDFLPKFLSSTFVRLYLLSLRISPKIYAFFYRWGNKEGSTASRDRLNKVLTYLARTNIVDFQPDIAIATHATPAGIISQLKADGYLPQCRLYGVVTDYVMHSWWHYNEVSAYFTADMPIANIQFGRGQALYKYGIPLREEFSQESLLSKEELRAKMGLPKGEIIYLLLGGGEGILPMQEIIASLKKFESKACIVAITGHNIKLYDSLRGLGVSGLTILGFVNNIRDYMAVADCVISKAGGISSTEILAQKVGYIVYKPLMGQEMNNALFLQDHFHVQIVNHPSELAEAIRLTREKQPVDRALVALDSTERIVREIFNLTKKHNCEYNV